MMTQLLHAVIALAALASPMLIVGGLMVVSERGDGQTRFVIVGGRTRRRSALERNRVGCHARSSP